MLCFSLGSRLRGNDGGGGCAGNDGGGSAGMTGLAGRTGFSPSDPLLISPWEGEGDGSRERGFNCDLKDGSGVLCFSLGSRLRGNDGGLAWE